MSGVRGDSSVFGHGKEVRKGGCELQDVHIGLCCKINASGSKYIRK